MIRSIILMLVYIGLVPTAFSADFNLNSQKSSISYSIVKKVVFDELEVLGVIKEDNKKNLSAKLVANDLENFSDLKGKIVWNKPFFKSDNAGRDRVIAKAFVGPVTIEFVKTDFNKSNHAFNSDIKLTLNGHTKTETVKGKLFSSNSNKSEVVYKGELTINRKDYEFTTEGSVPDVGINDNVTLKIDLFFDVNNQTLSEINKLKLTPFVAGQEIVIEEDDSFFAGVSAFFVNQLIDFQEWLNDDEEPAETKGSETVTQTDAKVEDEIDDNKVCSFEDITSAIKNDLETLAPEKRKTARYLSFYHLECSGASTVDFKISKDSIKFLINSLSWNKELVEVVATDELNSVYRFQLDEVKQVIKKDTFISWSETSIWNKLVSIEPYNKLYNDKDIEQIKSIMGTDEFPVLRADWFVSNASKSPLYEEILGISGTQEKLESILGVDVRGNVARGKAARAGFTDSGVSEFNRIIERHPTDFGAYWLSYDFDSNSGRKNIKHFPAGPDYIGKLSFEYDGGEYIFNLPNGLQAYFLTNGKGEQIQKGPINVVKHEARPDSRVHNGISCMSCHDQGINFKEDTIRQDSTQTIQFNDLLTTTEKARALKLIDILYTDKTIMNQLMQSDTETFQNAMNKMDVTIQDNVGYVENKYLGKTEGTVTLKKLSAELGVSQEDIKEVIKNNKTFQRYFSSLLSENGSVPFISREFFLTFLTDLNKEENEKALKYLKGEIDSTELLDSDDVLLDFILDENIDKTEAVTPLNSKEIDFYGEIVQTEHLEIADVDGTGLYEIFPKKEFTHDSELLDIFFTVWNTRPEMRARFNENKVIELEMRYNNGSIDHEEAFSLITDTVDKSTAILAIFYNLFEDAYITEDFPPRYETYLQNKELNEDDSITIERKAVIGDFQVIIDDFINYNQVSPEDNRLVYFVSSYIKVVKISESEKKHYAELLKKQKLEEKAKEEEQELNKNQVPEKTEVAPTITEKDEDPVTEKFKYSVHGIFLGDNIANYKAQKPESLSAHIKEDFDRYFITIDTNTSIFGEAVENSRDHYIFDNILVAAMVEPATGKIVSLKVSEFDFESGLKINYKKDFQNLHNEFDPKCEKFKNEIETQMNVRLTKHSYTDEKDWDDTEDKVEGTEYSVLLDDAQIVFNCEYTLTKDKSAFSRKDNERQIDISFTIESK